MKTFVAFNKDLLLGRSPQELEMILSVKEFENCVVETDKFFADYRKDRFPARKYYFSVEFDSEEDAVQYTLMNEQPVKSKLTCYVWGQSEQLWTSVYDEQGRFGWVQRDLPEDFT